MRAGSKRLPRVFLNLAMTADGKIAPANRRFVPFSSRRDQKHMMELRAEADAVMSGARTVDLNPVTLGPGGEKYRRLRAKRGLREYNLRVIVSGSGSIDPRAEIFKKRFSPIIILTTERAGPARLATLRSVADEVKVCGKTQIDFRAALVALRKEWKIKSLLCEGGGELVGGLFMAGVVNELHLTISPKIFGGREAPTIADGEGVEKLSQGCPLTLKSMKLISGDLFLIYQVRKTARALSTARKARANPRAG